MGLVMLSGTLTEKLLLRRFLLGMVGILAFSIIIGIAVAALLVAILYLGYRLMLEHGISSESGLIIIGWVTATLIIVLGGAAYYRFRRMQRAFTPRSTITNQVSRTVEAFIDGLMTPSSRKSND